MHVRACRGLLLSKPSVSKHSMRMYAVCVVKTLIGIQFWSWLYISPSFWAQEPASWLHDSRALHPCESPVLAPFGGRLASGWLGFARLPGMGLLAQPQCARLHGGALALGHPTRSFQEPHRQRHAKGLYGHACAPTAHVSARDARHGELWCGTCAWWARQGHSSCEILRGVSWCVWVQHWGRWWSVLFGRNCFQRSGRTPRTNCMSSKKIRAFVLEFSYIWCSISKRDREYQAKWTHWRKRRNRPIKIH